MIYTIGHTESYIDAIKQKGTIYKLGRRDGYSGGYAFQSIEDAQRRINEAHRDQGFAVFGILAQWNLDTEPSHDGWWHDLLIDAEIVVLETMDSHV